MSAPGRQSKLARTISARRSSEIFPVPKVCTSSDTGSATPIAYATCTSQRRARPAATTFLAM